MDDVRDTMMLQLGRIEGKLDAVTSAVGRAHDRIDSVERDVRVLERAQAKFTVYATMIAAAVATGAGLAVRKLFGA